jgi:hypothetical protein
LACPSIPSAVITAVITRYPILVNEVAQDEATELEIAPEMRPAQVVDLDQWIVAVTEPCSANGHKSLGELAHASPEPTTKSNFALSAPPTGFVWGSQSAEDANELQLALDFG